MPVCLASSTLIANVDDVYARNAASHTDSPAVVYVIKQSTSVQGCEAIAISGAEYQSLLASISASTGVPPSQTPTAWNELGNMSIADAQVISAYVAGVWAVAWGIRQIINAMSLNDGERNE